MDLKTDGSETSRVVRKLGWYTARVDGKVDQGLSPNPLSSEAWAEIQELTAVIGELRPFVIDYISLDENFTVLKGIEGDIATSFEMMPNALGFTGVQQTLALAKAQNALSNFLSSASSLRDRSCMRLRERYGKASTQFTGFGKTITAAYDRSFAYRLLYNLRNYGVHHDSPLSLIPVHGARHSSGKVEFTVSLVLRPEEMLRSEKIQNSFRAELGQQLDEIPLLMPITEYFDLHGSLMRFVIEMHLPRLIEFQDFGRALLTKMALPKGAMPMIWEGEDPRRQGHFHQFGFDELGFLQQLHGRLSGGHARQEEL